MVFGIVTGCGNSAPAEGENDTAATVTTQTEETTTEENTASAEESSEDATDEPLKIVTTIFPEYDWVKTILGDKAENVDMTLLLDNGVDLHSYQPTVEDIVKIKECDMFVYVGGESDEWVEEVLESSENENMVAINLLEVLGDNVKAEEIVEGMEHEHDHDHDHSKEVSTFEDSEVQDRELSDWEGDWQSAYPLVLDGSLDEAWEHKAEEGDMTAAEYKDYYTKGYKTDYTAISIHDNKISFTDDKGNVTESAYKYNGFYIQNWSTGTKAAMYRFEAEDKEAGAPIYIEFNDHIIEPADAEHFHIRMSNESYDAIVDPEGNWPTFFDASLSPEGVCDEVIGHGKHEDDEEDEEHEDADHEESEEHEDADHEESEEHEDADHGESEEHEDADHEEGEEHDHEHEEEKDEHVWLSLKNTSVLCKEIATQLGNIDEENKDLYMSNYEAYKTELDNLDAEYQAAVEAGNKDTILFGDRFPFRYMVDDYGLEYYAAFAGCSAESEASFETIVFLAGKVDELGLPAIMTIEGDEHKIAETVQENTESKDQKILTLDSMQSTTSKDIENGVTYLSIMKSNLEVLKEAIN
ncbi:MAG: ZinT/AdcA family metal-binding protein [Eubacterium sp.]|nr:ZinT/AdcA family metal-binding protein [Eubacterium sp.]